MYSGITEIMGRMTNRNAVNGDITEAMAMATGFLHDRYAKRLQLAFRDHWDRAAGEPGKEARLLAAMKPFTDGAGAARLDSAIEALQGLAAFNSIRNELAEQQSFPSRPMDNSVHPDGVYDIDYGCLAARRREAKPMMGLALIYLCCRSVRG